MKIAEITRELTRLLPIIEKAEIGNRLLVSADCGDQLTVTNPKDPYPMFFSTEELVEQIYKGNYHCGNWYLADKEEMKKSILNRIQELQERLIRL